MRYDTTLKELLMTGAPGLFELLLGDQPAEFLTVELPSVKMRKPDLVARLMGGALLHLEIQSDNEADFEWRELEYYLLLYRLYEQPPIQYVLYIGSEQLRMSNHIAHPLLQFRYILIDIRNLNGERLLESQMLSDQALALLCDNVTRTEVIRHLLSNVQPLPEKERRDWLEKIMILAGLRQAEELIKEEATKMGISLDIRNNKFFQEARAIGLEEGTEIGEARLLTLALTERFGPLPEWAQQRLAKLQRAEIEAAVKRLFTATKLEEVLTPNN